MFEFEYHLVLQILNNQYEPILVITSVETVLCLYVTTLFKPKINVLAIPS